VVLVRPLGQKLTQRAARPGNAVDNREGSMALSIDRVPPDGWSSRRARRLADVLHR